MTRAARFAFLPLIMTVALLAPLVFPHELSARTGVGIQVTPTFISPVLAAGDQTTEVVTVTNLSAGELTVSGQPRDAGEKQPDGATSLSVEPADVTLQPEESTTISINIRAAAETKEGHSSQLVAFQARPSSGGNISVSGQVDVTLDISVIHPVDDVEFSVPHLLDAGDEAVFSVKGSNRGKFPVRLLEAAQIDGLLGNAEINQQSQEIAVGESADMQVFWDDPPLIGLKRVTLQIGSGVGSPVEEKSWLIIFPWKFGVTLLTLGLIAAGGASLGKVFR